ncbi:MAG: aromatic ring-hydroxylating dioxygenase subunit alpha, partial [Rhodospirillales bacterium]|nr:aromatic ring-hydroxylating dioxygenase subunit alpha [Rhodospirillales bacterium]
ESYPTFQEDKVILEAQQANIDRRPDRELIAIQDDRAVFAARRAIKKMIEAEGAAKAAAE